MKPLLIASFQKFSLIFAFFIFFFLAGCKQANEKNLEGTWKMTVYRINHNDEHKDIKVTWQLKEDGSLQQVINYSGQEVQESARWKLLGDTALQILYPDNQQEVTWKIVKLNASSMSLEYTIPGFFVERSFVKMNE